MTGPCCRQTQTTGEWGYSKVHRVLPEFSQQQNPLVPACVSATAMQAWCPVREQRRLQPPDEVHSIKTQDGKVYSWRQLHGPCYCDTAHTFLLLDSMVLTWTMGLIMGLRNEQEPDACCILSGGVKQVASAKSKGLLGKAPGA